MQLTEPIALRPSVTFVDLGVDQESARLDFFQTNTRRLRSIRCKGSIFKDFVSALDGRLTAEQAAFKVVGSDQQRLLELNAFAKYLYDACLIELASVGNILRATPNSRTLEFLADFFPSHEVLGAGKKLADSGVLIVGCGGVGSWVVLQLAALGVSRIGIVDDDIVDVSNLNRSLFRTTNIGERKAVAISHLIERNFSDVSVLVLPRKILGDHDVEEILNEFGRPDLVINCADFPSIDATSSMIFPHLMQRSIPHIVAGGYNLHLSLVGPTILPEAGPCFFCIQRGLESLSGNSLNGIKKLQRPNRNIGSLAPLVGIGASFTINEAIRTILRGPRISPFMVGKRGEYNFYSKEFKTMDFRRIPDCPFCLQHRTGLSA
jgi:molybdopterin/thiamine biosynthesis adenylyltransferase